MYVTYITVFVYNILFQKSLQIWFRKAPERDTMLHGGNTQPAPEHNK